MQMSKRAVWSEYLQCTQKAVVGLRMEIMNPFNYRNIGNKNENLRIAFLAAFLDDNAVRDVTVNKERFEGPHAAFTIDKIEVRNFAAMQIASILNVDFQDGPNEFWTVEQWAALRMKVKRIISKLQLPSL